MDTLGGRGTGWQARLAVTASILPAGSAIGMRSIKGLNRAEQVP